MDSLKILKTTPKNSVACHRYPHENGNCLLDILYNYKYIFVYPMVIHFHSTLGM